MYHNIRWTPEKIKQRLELITLLVYIKRTSLPAFRYKELAGPNTPPPIEIVIDDSAWQEISADEYWGAWRQDFILRTRFAVPSDWDPSQPIALHLPIGEAGDFSHPEALAYIDGRPHAACDRHHQEIGLCDEWLDGKEHLLALHGWTGLGGSMTKFSPTRLFMRQCSVVQIHQPTRDLFALARVALETANSLDENQA